MATHWIDSASIDGFRNIRKLNLEGLGSLNIFVGENNSGKTSVLEAISILANYNDPSEWLNMVGRRDFGRLDETRPQSIRWCFNRDRFAKPSDENFEAKCEMSCTGKVGVVKLNVVCHDILVPSYTKSDTDETLESVADVPQMNRGIRVIHDLDFSGDPSLLAEIAQFGHLESPSFVVLEDNPLPMRPSRLRHERHIKTETLNPYTYQINRYQVSRLSEGKLSDSNGLVLNLLQEFDPEIVNIEIVSLRGMRPSIYIKHRLLGSAPLSIFGDALRRAVLLATTMLSFRNGGILFIDEIETGIHVHAIQRVFAWLAKAAIERGVQVFATTHSLEALDAIAFSLPNAQNEIVAYHLDQNHERTTAKRFDGELLTRLRRERGIDVR